MVALSAQDEGGYGGSAERSVWISNNSGQTIYSWTMTVTVPFGETLVPPGGSQGFTIVSQEVAGETIEYSVADNFGEGYQLVNGGHTNIFMTFAYTGAGSAFAEPTFTDVAGE